MRRQQNNEIHLQLRLDIITLVPVGILGFVVDNEFYFLCKRNEIFFGVFKIILDGERLLRMS